MKNSSADYREDMDSQLFENWFRDQLLPNIPENSVTVMNNASYHCRQLDKNPRKVTKKAEKSRINMGKPRKKLTREEKEILSYVSCKKKKKETDI
ncbi:unnamed protein product [Euphydryas editha]|uniref:Uncharacterized protein n=1 Tax=Euphydryas editha TaxID=104508 RepID=A0AAU9U8T4_EUPED|nr:unnamed protein product [Euphydryas editha]